MNDFSAQRHGLRRMRWPGLLLAILLALIAGGCNLGIGAEPTATPTATRTPTATPTATNTLVLPPTLLPPPVIPTSTQIGFPGIVPTLRPPATLIPPTRIAVIGTPIPPINQMIATSPPGVIIIPPGGNLPAGTINISISAPLSNTEIRGIVPITGSAQHPNFLQYQVEYGPYPNPGNLWYPLGAPVQQQVVNGPLGSFNTALVSNAAYTLRLKVFLRDGSVVTVVNENVRVANPTPTPIPTATLSTPRPYAAFTADRYLARVNEIVRFFDRSGGTITSWNWNFGDGTLSTLREPGHAFTAPGVYPVTLTVSGPGGSTSVTAFISVYMDTAPIAAFEASPTVGTAPLEVRFQNASSANATAFLWNFGNGQQSSQRDPIVVYTAPGTYTVTLMATGPGGSSSTQRVITVLPAATPITAPSASFNLSTMGGPAPLLVEFFNTSTGSITSYSWDFGDGQFSSEANPVHLYTQPGEYRVTLLVTGPGGQSFAERGLSVHALPTSTPTNTPLPPTLTPSPTFTPSQTPTVTPMPPTNTPIVIVITASPVPITATPVVTATPLPPTATFTPTFTVEPPTLTFTPTPTNTEAATSTPLPPTDLPTSTAEPPTATPVPPTSTPVLPTATPLPVEVSFATFNADPMNPRLLQFIPQVVNGNPVAFNWNFGDGVGTSAEQTPFYTFAAGGDYLVTLTVTTDDGRQASAQQVVSIVLPTATPLPVEVSFATFNADPMNPLLLQFIPQVVNGNPVAFNWNFGDGVGTSAEQSPFYTFAAGGDYLVTLTVTTDDGRQASTEQIITVVAPVEPPPITEPPPAGQPPAITVSGFSAVPSALVWSPFGTIFASGDENADVIFWNALTAMPTATITDFSDTISALAWSPNGALIAAASYDGQAAIYDANTAIQVVLLSEQPDLLRSLRFSPDGSYLAGGAADGSVIVWDMGGNVISLFAAHNDAVTGIAWSPDGSLLLTGSADTRAIAWEWTSGTPVWEGGAHSQPINSIALSPDGGRLATASDEGLVYVWNLITRAPLPELTLSGGDAFTAVAWSPSGTYLFTGAADGSVTVWNSLSGAAQTALTGHSGAITALAVNAVQMQLAAASEDQTVLIWDISATP
jgi:PKD repeat protein